MFYTVATSTFELWLIYVVSNMAGDDHTSRVDDNHVVPRSCHHIMDRVGTRIWLNKKIAKATTLTSFDVVNTIDVYIYYTSRIVRTRIKQYVRAPVIRTIDHRLVYQ